MAKQLVEQKRTLVHEDLNGFKFPLQSITKVISLANDVAINYEALNLGPFSYEVFNDIIEHDTLNVRMSYLAKLRSDIKKHNIDNPSIQHIMIGDIDRVIEPLKTSIKELKKYSSNRIGYYSLKLEYKKASFENSRFLLTNDDQERLKDEFCRIYVDDEKQSLALGSLRSFVDAYNKLLESVSVMNPEMTTDMIRNPLKVWEYIQIENQTASVYNPNLGHFLLTAQ